MARTFWEKLNPFNTLKVKEEVGVPTTKGDVSLEVLVDKKGYIHIRENTKYQQGTWTFYNKNGKLLSFFAVVTVKDKGTQQTHYDVQRFTNFIGDKRPGPLNFRNQNGIISLDLRIPHRSEITIESRCFFNREDAVKEMEYLTAKKI